MAADSRLVAAGDGPTCTIQVDGQEYVAREWCLDDDVLQLGDQFACDIPNIDLATGKAGALSGRLRLGAKLEVLTADPAVAGGRPVRQMIGRVVKITHTSDWQGGSIIRLVGADLGWHLTSTCGPPFFNLEGARMQRLLDAVIDPAWGIGALRDDHILGKRLRQGREGAQRAQKVVGAKGVGFGQEQAPQPTIQIQPGEIIAELLIRYARRDRRLVNVAPDGALEIFRPRRAADPIDDPLWRLEYHGASNRKRNNILDGPTIEEDITSVYSEVRCFSTRLVPLSTEFKGKKTNPNDNYLSARYRPSPSPLPFPRLHVFSEPDAITDEQRQERAKWRWQRGMFDAWRYQAAIRGHSQGGYFITSDTIAALNDSFHGLRGQYYVRSVRRSFTFSHGYRAELTLHKLGLLGA